jgi:pimeloyl-ACP methyl ester carboxylesterase
MVTSVSGERAVGRDHLGWPLYESGPEVAAHTILLLPGALCSAAFYDDLIAEPSLQSASIRFVATTLPGFGSTEPLDDLSIENYARVAAGVAADLGCDAVVGHSLGANVALEMVASGGFNGPVVLLSPSLSREDESKFPRALDVLSRVLGHVPYSLMLRMIGPAMKSSLPPARRDALIAELRNNDPRFLRRQTRVYLEYLDRHGSLASRLGAADVPTTIVFGERDDVGLTENERRALTRYPNVTIVEIPDAGHFTLNEQPGRVAELVLDALGSLPRQP